MRKALNPEGKQIKVRRIISLQSERDQVKYAWIISLAVINIIVTRYSGMEQFGAVDGKKKKK